MLYLTEDHIDELACMDRGVANKHTTPVAICDEEDIIFYYSEGRPYLIIEGVEISGLISVSINYITASDKTTGIPAIVYHRYTEDGEIEQCFYNK